jgi:hypothetical protein
MSELLPCPFCGAQPTIRTNRDWHHLQADHDDGCPMGERVVSFPATDDDRVALVQTWNRRVRPAPPSAPGLAVARERWFKDWAERGLAPLGLAHGMAFDAGWDAALRAAEQRGPDGWVVMLPGDPAPQRTYWNTGPGASIAPAKGTAERHAALLEGATVRPVYFGAAPAAESEG